VAAVIHHHVPEAITSGRENINLEAAKAVLLGPGMGTDDEFILHKVLNETRRPLVIDADGLNMAAKDVSLLRRLRVPCVITPHPGEMSRLTGLSVEQILQNPIAVARGFAREYNVHVLLKGARTVIAAPNGNAFLNVTGSPALAKAGTGDVLAGIIAGLVALGLDVFKAAAVGAFLHGKAGEKLQIHGALARDVIDALPGVMAEIV
jgi:NAD(P)H-hydrate epimerase